MPRGATRTPESYSVRMLILAINVMDDVSIRHLVVAARLVALVQVSSASVERVFSQVKLICETCGVSPLEETLETRLMERVNQYED